MGLVLDLAVVALAVAVTVSLVTLGWTLGVTAVAAARRATRRAALVRADLVDLERRLAASADEARRAVDELAGSVLARVDAGRIR